MKGAAVAAERDGHADESGDAGAVNLRDTVEIDDDFAGAAFHDGRESGGELITGIADGETAVDVKDDDVAFAVHVDFDGSVLGHLSARISDASSETRWALYDEARAEKQMRLAVKHEWAVNSAEARWIQQELRKNGKAKAGWE